MNLVIRGSYIMDKVGMAMTRLRRVFRRTTRRLRSGLAAISLTRGKQMLRKGKHKVVVIGGFGWHDIGDEAMPRADIRNLRTRLKDIDIVMLSPNPEYTRDYHGERSVHDVDDLGYRRNSGTRGKLAFASRTLLFLAGALAERHGLHMRMWPEARAVLDEIHSADVLFNVGGGNLNSLIPGELYKKCTSYVAAKILKKPVILSGQTIGPLARGSDTIYARFCLSRVDLITLRDRETSRQRLRAAGVSGPLVVDAADDAMTVPQVPRDQALDVLKSIASPTWWDNRSSLLVAMNVSGSLKVYKGDGRNSSLGHECELMARVADALISFHGAKVLFVPTHYHGADDDRPLHKEIVSLMEHSHGALCVDGEYDDALLKGLISVSDAAIGVRYHFAVFAAGALVPFLGMASGLYQQTKLKGLADLCGVPQCYVPEDMEFATFDQIWPEVDRFVNDRDSIARQLKSRVPILNQRSTMAIDRVVRFLESRT
jgi:polysaccharide pyruvyl transferase WcaK-like protein